MSTKNSDEESIMKRLYRITSIPAIPASDDQYYEDLERLTVVDSGSDYRLAWSGPQADMVTAQMRLNCTDDDAPELGPWPMCHSEIITRQDCENEFAVARWCRAHGAGWVIRHHLLGQVLAMLQDRWSHAQEYMARFDLSNGHGRPPLAPSLRSCAGSRLIYGGGAMMTFADKALPVVARGVAVFPCNPDTKAPLCQGGFKSATTDADIVRSWSRRWPDALVGQPLTGDVFCLDADTGPGHSADGFKTLQEHGWEIPATRCHHTRGGGRHYFMRAPANQPVGSTAGKLGPGLDTRGNGTGYIVRWDLEGFPVEHPDIIGYAPDWLLTVLTGAPRPGVSITPGYMGTVDNSALWGGIHPEFTPSRIVYLLAAIDPDCSYDDWIRVGMALAHELGDPGLAFWDGWSSLGKKYPDQKVLLRHWNSFTDRPGPTVTAGTLVALATANKKEAVHAR